MSLVNSMNQHDSALFTSKVGAVDGYIGGSNPNIQRGGGYGFNGKGMPGFGPMPIKSYSNCGTLKTPDLGVGKQYVGSPPPQRGGSSAAGCAGVPYASFVKPVPGLTNYAPVTQECHSQCGGKKRRHTKRRRRKTKHRRHRRKRRQTKHRRRQRGGYYQYGSDIPNTPGYSTPAGGNWQTANPPTYTRINANGTGSCVDNFNAFTGKGAAIPITDGDVKQSGGSSCRRRGGRRRTKHRRRRTKHRRRRTKHRRRRTKHRRRRGGHHHR